MTTRRCLKCEGCYPLSPAYFYRHGNGWRRVCKSCLRAYCYAWRREHREQVRATARAWYARNCAGVLRARRAKRLARVLERIRER